MKMRKLLSFALVLCMVLAMLPITVQAEEGNASGGIHVNPRYADSFVMQEGTGSAVPVHTDGDFVSEEEAVLQIRASMVNREGQYTVFVKSDNADGEALLDTLMENAMAHTGNPKEGDSLLWAWESWRCDYHCTQDNDEYLHTFAIEMTYLTTLEQERELDIAVDAVLAELNLDNASDYRKARGVYGYITRNVYYDEAHLYLDHYTLKYTPYAALVEGLAVSQGCSLLLYRLLLELGVDCRVIAGYSGYGIFCWNLIKQGYRYYHADATNDLQGDCFYYCLKGEEEFRDILRLAKYDTVAFHNAYPMGTYDYEMGNPEPPAEPMEDVVITGDPCGDGLDWQLDGGVLTISGTGPMYDMSWDESPWKEHVNRIEKLVVEEGVTSLGNYAFHSAISLEEISLPGSLERIGRNAFRSCYSLEAVEIPEGLTIIEEYAFYECVSLKQAILPDSVREIEDFVFAFCHALAEVRLPEGITRLGEQVFRECKSLSQVEIPDSLTRLEYGLFSNCESLTSIVIGPNVTALGEVVFFNCTSLGEIRFEGDAPIIGNRVFRGVTANVYYPAENATWTEVVRQNYEGQVTWIPTSSGEMIAMELVSTPDTVSYVKGDSLCLEGLVVKGIYDDGVETILSHNWLDVSCDLATTGVKEVTLSYNGFSVVFEVYIHSERSLITLDPATYPESDHELDWRNDETQIFTYPGAEYLVLDFSELCYLVQNCDYLYVSDGEGNLLDVYTGYRAAGATLTIPGDTVQIRLDKDSYVAWYGYSLDRIQASVICHEGTGDEDVAPGCTTDGYCSGYHCEICGEWIPPHTIYSTGHDYVGVVTEPTCGERGYTTYTCTTCGDVCWDDFVNALGHDFSWGVDTVQPTDTQYGAMYTHCDNCGETVQLMLPRNITAPEGLPFADYEWEILQISNAVRTAAGLDPVVGFEILQEAAGIRAGELDEYYSHTRPDGSSCFSVFDELGLEYTSAGENIAYGQSNAVHVMDSWLNSDGHRENILGGYFGFLGVGFEDLSRKCWVQMFLGETDWESFELVLPENRTFEMGTLIDEMGIYAKVRADEYGYAYLPIQSVYCMGYNPSAEGVQTVTVGVYGYTRTFTVTIEGGDPCMAGHTGERRNAVEATCTEPGYTGDSYCAFCELLLETGSEIPALGHDFVEGICSRCGEADPDYVPVSGTCGDNAAWTFEEATGILTVSGTGEMYDYYGEGAPWQIHREQITAVVVEHGITSIGPAAFWYLPALAEVTIPDTVTYIDNFAFLSCVSLESIELPDALTGIGQQAFSGCTALTSVEIPATVTFVDACAFGDCAGLTEVLFHSNPNIPSFVMGNSVFRSCTALEEIQVEEGHLALRSIDGVLYFDSGSGQLLLNDYPANKKDSEYRLADNCVAINQLAFERNPWLETVIIPDTVTYIGSSVFQACNGLKNMIFEGSMPEVGNNVFFACDITIRYPCSDDSWNARDSWNDLCGSQGSITWKPDHQYVDGFCSDCGEEEPAYTLGDVNDDGVVNNIDAMLILQYAVGLLTDGDLNLEAADVNSDGSANNIDAMLVLQFAVGLLDRFN